MGTAENPKPEVRLEFLLHSLPPTVLPLPSQRALCRWGN